jgi:HAD superfamily hydrolase (TIGR01450 family)
MTVERPLTLLCDLDGVLWHRTLVLDGVQEALKNLSQASSEVHFVTNNSFTPVSELEARISELGYSASGRVVTSPMITASFMPQGSRILVLAGAGTLELIQLFGHTICDWDDDPEFVVVGLRTDFDYDMLKRATFAIRRGAVLVATNDDPSYPTDEGILPGSGAIVSAMAVAAGVVPTVIGKPNYPAVDFVKRRINNSVIDFVIGDRIMQDGLFAKRLNSKFLLISDEEQPLHLVGEIPIEHQFGGLKDAVDFLLSRSNSSDFSRS